MRTLVSLLFLLTARQRQDKEGTDAPSLDELGRLGETHERALSKAERAPARQRRWIADHGGVEVHAGVLIEAGDVRGVNT